jgi:arsenate reductase-like glutaredoxin family protein
LEESFEGTKAIKGAKAYIFKEKFASFKMKEDESVPDMFYRMEVLVNDLKALSEKVEDKDFFHKFLRCLPTRFGMLVTLLVRTNLDTITPNQILGDIMIDDAYRDDHEKKEKKDKKDEKKDEKKKSVAFKATSSSKGKAKQESLSEDEDLSFDKMDGEKMTLFVKRFGKFMVKKGYSARWKKSSSKNKEESRKCFKCGSKDHLIFQCPYNSDNDDDDKKSKKDKKKKEKKDKMTIKKKKKGGSHVVTWDSDVSSSDDDVSDDNKTTKKKAYASIAINKKPSLFDTPSCFVAKATKVQTCDEEHDNESESKSYNDDEPTKDELIDMLEDAKEYFDIKRRECKDLHKELKALKQAFDELNLSHERMEKAHEKLGKTYKKLEKVHSSLLNEQNEKEHVVTCDKGLTCDIIDESFYKPTIVAPTNPSSSTSTFTSSNSDGFTL